jgi:hypothetical protein
MRRLTRAAEAAAETVDEAGDSVNPKCISITLTFMFGAMLVVPGRGYRYCVVIVRFPNNYFWY